MLLQINPATRWNRSLYGRLSDSKSVCVCVCDGRGGGGGVLKNTQNLMVVLNGSCGLLRLPADSPVLIQSGFAMLAMAKISAARNRQPEMIVSLSISPADEEVNDVEKNVEVVVQM